MEGWPQSSTQICFLNKQLHSSAGWAHRQLLQLHDTGSASPSSEEQDKDQDRFHIISLREPNAGAQSCSIILHF